MSFYSLNRRYFDYKAGTGYFRDYIDDPSKEWRGSAAVRSNGTKHTRQWPKWPPHWNCLEEDAAPPWDPTFFEELQLMIKDEELGRTIHDSVTGGIFYGS